MDEIGGEQSEVAKSRGSRSKNVDANLRLNVESKQAIRSVQEFERKLSKLGSMAHQGEYQSNGLLTKKQVQMYRNIMKEIEAAYSKHQQDLAGMEEEYAKRLEARKKSLQELKKLEQEALSAQRKYNVASGDNPKGRPASESVQSRLKEERDSAVSRVTSFKDSMNDDGIPDLARNINSLRSSIDQLSNSRDKADAYSERISNMRQDNPDAKRLALNMMNLMAGATGVYGLRQYAGYVKKGVGTLRYEERLSSQIAQRSLTNYQDDDYRDSVKALGEQSNYSIGETLSLQQEIIKGGTKGNKENLNSDTKAYQQYSRAFAVDATDMASTGAMLQKMGTFEEGDMQHFADLLAGAISKEGLAGREEELLRTTSSLAEKVSQGQVGLSDEKFSDLVGMQTLLGASVSQFKGDAGTKILSNIDTGIKNSGSNFDLLLGKGTEFVGLSGMADLERAKEQGLTPDNIKRIYDNSIKMFGSFDNEMTRYAFKNNLGVSFTEFDAMQKAGYWESIANGYTPSASELESIGANTTLESLNNYNNSETARVDSLNAKSSNLNADHSKAYDEVDKTTRGLFHNLPDPVKHGLLFGAGVFGPSLLRKAGGSLLRSNFGSTLIGGTGASGGGGFLANLLRGGATTATTSTTATNGAVRGLNRLGQFLGTSSGNLTTTISTGVSNALSNASVYTNLATATGKAVAGGVGLLSGISTYVQDRKANPQTSTGRSVTKAVGSAVGGTAGWVASAGAGAAIGTAIGGPVGTLVGIGVQLLASAIGSKIGEKVGDVAYSSVKGDDDKVTETVKAQRDTQASIIAKKFNAVNTSGFTQEQLKGLRDHETMYIDRMNSADSQEKISYIIDSTNKYLQKLGESAENATFSLGKMSSGMVNLFKNGSSTGSNNGSVRSGTYTGSMSTPLTYYSNMDNGKVAYNYNYNNPKLFDNNKQVDTKLFDTLSKMFPNGESALQRLEVVISGRVDGMTDDNQKTIVDSIKTAIGQFGFGKINLAQDQGRV